MECAKCEFINPDETKFCVECVGILEKKCPGCGHLNQLQFKFCGECGHSFEGNDPPIDLSEPQSYSTDEAEIALSMRPFPEAVSTIAERMNRDENDLGDTLYQMSKKGLILRFKESEEIAYYFLAPWMVGIWEFQVNRLTPDNIKLYEKYYQEGMVPMNKKAREVLYEN